MVCFTVPPGQSEDDHIEADTHTQWRLAEGGSTAAEGLRRVVWLGAQLRNSSEMWTVPVVPDIQGDLQ